MIKSTEHFILDYRKVTDMCGHSGYLSGDNGVRICVKNNDGTMSEVLYVMPNKQIKFMEDPGSYIQTIGTMLQDTITSWDLWVELTKLLDEANYMVGMAIVSKNFNDYLG